jgi:hypothetical protein
VKSFVAVHRKNMVNVDESCQLSFSVTSWDEASTKMPPLLNNGMRAPFYDGDVVGIFNADALQLRFCDGCVASFPTVSAAVIAPSVNSFRERWVVKFIGTPGDGVVQFTSAAGGLLGYADDTRHAGKNAPLAHQASADALQGRAWRLRFNGDDYTWSLSPGTVDGSDTLDDRVLNVCKDCGMSMGTGGRLPILLSKDASVASRFSFVRLDHAQDTLAQRDLVDEQGVTTAKWTQLPIASPIKLTPTFNYALMIRLPSSSLSACLLPDDKSPFPTAFMFDGDYKPIRALPGYAAWRIEKVSDSPTPTVRLRSSLGLSVVAGNSILTSGDTRSFRKAGVTADSEQSRTSPYRVWTAYYDDRVDWVMETLVPYHYGLFENLLNPERGFPVIALRSTSVPGHYLGVCDDCDWRKDSTSIALLNTTTADWRVRITLLNMNAIWDPTQGANVFRYEIGLPVPL